MIITVHRFTSDGDSTLGLLRIDGVFECFTLEDEYREVKVPGETRIPEGDYAVRIRDVGGFHQKYSKRFPDMHKGMLEIINIPNFQYVLFHCGNTDEDTEACVLVGAGAVSFQKGMSLSGSTDAYVKFYKHVIKECLAGNLRVHVIDEDRRKP